MLLTFLSDFGTDDVFVGLCHGVIARHAPQARVVDLTHAVPPQDVLTGACRLLDCMAYLPPAVHLAVVDPGVGTERRSVVLEAGPPAQRSWFVGPDNGLLVPAARAAGGSIAAWAVTADDRASATFHGRDVFAPTAARLAAGRRPDELGMPFDAGTLVEIGQPQSSVHGGALVTAVRDIDRYGNVQLFARRHDLAAVGRNGDDTATRHGAGPRGLRVTVGDAPTAAPLVSTFAELRAGQLGIIVDSFGWLALVVGSGSAAQRLNVGRRAEVRLSAAQA